MIKKKDINNGVTYRLISCTPQGVAYFFNVVVSPEAKLDDILLSGVYQHYQLMKAFYRDYFAEKDTRWSLTVNDLLNDEVEYSFTIKSVKLTRVLTYSTKLD